MTDLDSEFLARQRVLRGYVPHCGVCGLPYRSNVGARECAGHDMVGMNAAIDTFKRGCEAAIPAVQAFASFGVLPTAPAQPSLEETPPPPSGWRDRPGLL